MTTTTETLTEHVERCYRAADWDGLRDVYAPGVLFDVHVPTWRFQLQGPDALIGWFEEQTARFTNFRVSWVRATPTNGGVVVEWEMHEGSPDDDHLCRQVDILHGDGEHIFEHVVWCTGLWDAPTIARHKAEAPMVRW